MDVSYHQEKLGKHCRICGTAYPRGYQDKKDKRAVQDLVIDCYNINVNEEDEQVYPPYICLKCYAQMSRIVAAKGKKYIHPAVAVFNWQPHSSSCETCDHFERVAKGGRPKKGRNNRGRPAGESTSQIMASVRAVAGECLVAAVDPARIAVSQVDQSHLVCPLCKRVVDGPVQLGCEKLACAECVVQLLLTQGPNTRCPSCDASASSQHFAKCPHVLLELLGNLRVKCSRGCHLSVTLRHLASHEKGCNPHVSPPLLPTMFDVSLGEVLIAPLDTPLCPGEQLACTHLVKRAIKGSANPSLLLLKTGGQVCYMCATKLSHTISTLHTIYFMQSLAFHRTAIPRVSSSEASDRTHRRRDTLTEQRESISGGRDDARKQLQMEVRAMPKEERQKLLTEAGLGVEMDTTQVLAIKADLAIPWYRLRVLRRCVSQKYRK